MSSSRTVLALRCAALVLVGGLAACTVRPLYAERPLTDSTQTAATGRVASIGVNPPRTREEQQVYNHMIFLLNGGAGQPADPRYSLSLGVVVTQISTARAQLEEGRPDERQPTSAALIAISNYALTDAETGKVVAKGRRQISSSFDVPRQEFAALRATRDAQDRAARELAELVRLAVLQDMNGLGVQ